MRAVDAREVVLDITLLPLALGRGFVSKTVLLSGRLVYPPKVGCALFKFIHFRYTTHASKNRIDAGTAPIP